MLKGNTNKRAEEIQRHFFLLFFFLQFCISNLIFGVIRGIRPTEAGLGKRHFGFGSSVKITSCSIFTDNVVFKTKLAERFFCVLAGKCLFFFFLNQLFL